MLTKNYKSRIVIETTMFVLIDRQILLKKASAIQLNMWLRFGEEEDLMKGALFEGIPGLEASF